MDHFDVLVVGCGLSGAVIARMLADNGYKVQIMDRRNHIGGNMYDYTDEHGGKEIFSVDLDIKSWRRGELTEYDGRFLF